MNERDGSLYRPGVAAIILCSRGELAIPHSPGVPAGSPRLEARASDSGTSLVLACRRRDAWGWQLPQGGIELGESPEQAVLRELREEIGTDRVEILARTTRSYSYEWPQGSRRPGDLRIGQTHIYFRMRPRPDFSPQESPDFDRFEWIEWEELLSRAVEFKRDPYRQASAELEP